MVRNIATRSSMSSSIGSGGDHGATVFAANGYYARALAGFGYGLPQPVVMEGLEIRFEAVHDRVSRGTASTSSRLPSYLRTTTRKIVGVRFSVSLAYRPAVIVNSRVPAATPCSLRSR